MAWIKAYKGFNKDMTCREFQFEEGKEYFLPEVEEAKLCESGFHACEAPIDCFVYYAPGESVYHEVELDATNEKKDDTKRCGKRIKIGAKLDVAKICKAQFEYVKEHCTNTENGGNGSALNGGNGSALNGGNGSALNGGNGSALNGGYGSALNGGYRSALNGGNRSALNGGHRSALNGGNGSALNGGYGSALRGGAGSKFNGGKWAVFACEELNEIGEIIGMKVAVVDGKKIKSDTWYTLKDGEFVEVEGDG